MAQPNARVCVCSGCRRVPAEGQSICGRCSKHVPAEVWLAIHDHADAYRLVPTTEGFTRADVEAMETFIGWSWNVTHRFAAHEASRRRFARRQDMDPDHTMHVYVITPEGEVAYVRRELSTEGPRP